MPGWPELAACTASIDSVRMVLMASWSSCGVGHASFLRVAQSSAAARRGRRCAALPLAISITTERGCTT